MAFAMKSEDEMNEKSSGLEGLRAAAGTFWPTIFFGAALLLWPAGLFALDPAKSLFQFNCQNWTRLAGLPADKISTITQTSDGYIWLGGQNGLIRFDGLEFKVVPIALTEAQGQDVQRLSASPKGRLWFSITNGGYGSYGDHKFTSIADPRWTVAGMNACSIRAAHDGAIWTGSVYGWGRWMPGKPNETSFDEKLGPVLTFWEDNLNRMWVGTAERGLFYWEKGELKLFPDGDLKRLNICSITRDATGDLWVGTSRGLYRYDAQFRRKEIFFPTAQTSALLVDRHGVLWVGTSEFGLGRYQDGKFTFLQKADGLGSDDVLALFEDAEGSLWVGTVEGLSQLSDLKFPIYSSKEGLNAGGAIAVAASAKGGLWIAMAMGTSYFDGKTIINYTDPKLLPNRYTRRVFEAKNGDVFFCDGNRNISVLHEGKLVHLFANDTWPEALVEDASGVLIGLGPTLNRYHDGQIEPYRFAGEAPNFNWFNHLSVSRDGAIWAGTNNGLFRIQAGKVRHWSTADGLSSDRVHYVVEDVDGSIWCGLPTGLVRIKGDRVTRITEEDGLTNGRIYAIVPDDHGFFWLASGHGILRVSRESLTDFADGRARRISCETFDGLESVRFIDRTDQGFSACKTLDGRIWFPNPRGVVMIDPAHYVTNTVPPRVYVEKIRVKGSDFAGQRSSSLKVGDRSVEFFFTALSFIAPKKIHVRYQLEGFDADWIDAGAHRSVTYNNLSAGHYLFHVQAANADGIWNTTGDDYSIELPPPFYQTLWFYASAAAASALLLIGVYRWKVRHMRLEQRKLQAANEVLERKVHQRTDELANSLSLLKATLDSTADGILAIQFSGEIVSYNRPFTEMWGIPPDLMQHARDADVQDFTAAQTKDPQQFLARVKEIHAAGEAEAFDVIEMKDGRLLERYCKPQRIGGKAVGIVINFRDITERKRAEAAVAETSALMEALLKNSLDFIYFKDRESRFVRYSNTLLQYFHLTDPDALKGKTDFDCYPEEAARLTLADEQTIMRTGQPLVGKLERQVGADGRVFWILTTKMPWRDANGDIVGTFGISRDVSAVKDAETELAYERDLLRALLDSSPDNIYFKDRASRFIRCSKAQAASFKAVTMDEIIGKTDFDFFATDHARAAFEDEQEIIRTGRPLIGKIEKEVWLDGRVSWVLTSKMPHRNGAGEIIGTVGISKDITALKNAEAKLEDVHRQLLETSRQAGMAEVATSVLHNVGNVLNSVNVSATLVAEQMRDSKAAFVSKISAMLQANLNDLGAFLSSDAKGKKIPDYLATLSDELLSEQRAMTEELGHLRKNVEHIKEIVAMQQNFAKVSGLAEAVPLVELIDDAVRINASALTRHDVDLVCDYQARPTVTLERHQLMQLLVNLIRNAKNACEESGRTDKKMIIRMTQHGDRVRIAVIDNGVGIAAENLTRIFSHGFTTRKEGHGFGLHSGAIVAKELGGSITAQSDGPGLGAMFTVELPIDAAHGPDLGDACEPAEVGHETTGATA